jgi:hypothetical protein
MKVSGVVVIDLTKIRLDSSDAASTAKGAIWHALADAPPGADVRLIVPRWDWWAQFAVPTVMEFGAHIATITVESTDPATVGQWVRQLRQEARADEVMGR